MKIIFAGLNKWLEKRSDGQYYPTHVSTYDWKDTAGDKGRIKKAIAEWEAKAKE